MGRGWVKWGGAGWGKVGWVELYPSRPFRVGDLDAGFGGVLFFVGNQSTFAGEHPHMNKPELIHMG